jgi:ribosomal protein L11 methyltransferase
VDIDPQALSATHENLQRNGVDDTRVEIYLPEQQISQPVDYLIANILSGPLIALLPRFAAMTRPGAQLVLSGILEEQADDIVQAYSQYFILDAVTIKDQWCRVTGIRNTIIES